MSRLGPVKNFVLALTLAVLLFLSAVAIPLVGAVLIPLMPQPGLGYGTRYGNGKGAALVFATLGLLVLIGGKEMAWSYAPVALMIVILLCSFGRGWPIERLVIVSASMMLAAMVAGFWFLFGSFADIANGIRGILSENLDISLKAFEKMGLAQEGRDLLKTHAPQMIDIIVQILPALALAGFMFLILINLLLLYRRFPEHRSYLWTSPDLREWKAPEFLVWCFIASGFALFLPGRDVLRIPALNIFLLIAIFYFFQGLAIIAYYFHHKNVPHFLRSLAYALIVFEQIFTIFVVGLGLFDLWGDFRRLNKKDLSPGRVS
ncbi:MAG: DUF2232 domain-containing protein [Deltaproteobacteria bacterium]|nr:DUF2232 domain-containing protein [Deltaproteobacteria bacterium]